MRDYCTYFDANYLTRGLTLYRSLERHEGPFRLWVLCLDDESFEILETLALPSLVPVPLATLEVADPELLQTKATRSRVEYFFTLTPSWIRHLLLHDATGETVTYLDADLLFFSSPDPIFDELGAASVAIIGHRFPEHLRELERHGVYNVGYLTFRDDADGRACVDHWREQCLEWCYDRVEEGRFGDQKYLDAWPARFGGVRVIEHPGAGLAPWNFMSYAIDPDTVPPTVNGEPLIFYHYHGVKLFSRWIFDTGLAPYGVMPRHVRRFLYGRYVAELKRTAARARRAAPGVRLGYASIRTGADTVRSIGRKLLDGQAMISVPAVGAIGR